MPSYVRLSEIKLHNRETAIEATRGARTPQRLYVPPISQSERGGLLGLEQGCHHLPATSTNHGIELHSNMVINPGTTRTCANEHHSSLAQGHPCLSGVLVLERPIKEDETKP